MLSGGATVTEQLTVPALPFLSVIVTVYENVPAIVGTPEMVPVEDIVRPAGRPVAEKVNGAPVPPLPVIVTGVIGVPTIAVMLTQLAVGSPPIVIPQPEEAVS